MHYLYWILIVTNIIIVLAAVEHALLYKRDPKGALGWIALCVIFPVGGPILYFLFGINRVRTRAMRLDAYFPDRVEGDPAITGFRDKFMVSADQIPKGLALIAQISDAVINRPLVGGNRIEPLHNGEEAYPAMLEAIDNAEHTIYLASYILDTNATGTQFIDALSRATARGVDVRVIIDGIGELYAFPRAGSRLKKQGIRFARFLSPRLIPPAVHINLRNHRKILVADCCIGFVGGMNIGDRHLAGNLDNPSRVVDIHFRLTGPVVNQIEEVFIEDWQFCTGERLLPSLPRAGQGDGAVCRTIVDGPNEDLDKLAMILVGAVSTAQKSISIMTPYFLPSRELIGALQSAALRGVHVTVILPARNNLPFVHWASRNILWELLQRGVRIYYQPPPFVHSKLFIVDSLYTQIGSANIDPRSLRLNFELAVEVYDETFARALEAHFQKVRDTSREITLEEVDNRPLPARTRDALAWLFTPYL